MTGIPNENNFPERLIVLLIFDKIILVSLSPCTFCRTFKAFSHSDFSTKDLGMSGTKSSKIKNNAAGIVSDANNQRQPIALSQESSHCLAI